MNRKVVKALALTGLISLSTTVGASLGLKAQVRFELPSHITTIGAAADWFLEPHGYELLLSGTAPIEARAIAVQSLPPTLPHGRVMSVEDALLAITTSSQAVIVDVNNRLVSFELHRGGVQ